MDICSRPSTVDQDHSGCPTTLRATERGITVTVVTEIPDVN